MKLTKKHLFNLSLSLFLAANAFVFSETTFSNQNSFTQQTGSTSSSTANFRVINTRKCLEDSKMSKHERVTLDKMKSQMETVLKEKEKAIHEIESKLKDEDYMDSIADDLERELRHKKKVLVEEGMELTRQFSENLELTNMKIIQSIIEAIGVASKDVIKDLQSKNQNVEAVFSSEACTYYAPSLDITDAILAKMDALFTAKQATQKQ